MKLAKILMLAALCLALPACSVSTRSAKLVVPPPAPKLARPDSALVTKCVGPVDLGNDPLTQERLEELWKTDRARLLSCIRRHLALRDFYADRDSALEGGK